MNYTSTAIDTAAVILPDDILSLTERLARNTHDLWAQQRLAEGWRYGSLRDEQRKEHPCLVDYDLLPESEKEYDRISALQTIKVLIALGYRIERA